VKRQSREIRGQPGLATTIPIALRLCFAAMGAVVALALLGALAARVLLGYPRPVRPAQVLSRAEIAFLEAVAESILPPGGAVPISGGEAGVAGYVDRLVAASQPRQRWLMRALFVLIEHATLVFPAPGGISGLRRFSKLRPDQQAAVIEGWRSSRLFPRRLVFTALRSLCAIGYLADPAVLRLLSLAPYAIDTPIVEADLLYPRIGESRASIALTRADLSPPGQAPPLAGDEPLLRGYSDPSR
jgi:hypothetical protein